MNRFHQNNRAYLANVNSQPVVEPRGLIRSRQGSLTLVGVVSTIRSPVNTITGSLLLAGIAPQVAMGKSITPGVGAATLAGIASTAVQSGVRVPGAGSLTLTGITPTRSIAVGNDTGVVQIHGQLPEIR